MKWRRIIGWTLAGLGILLFVAAVGGYLYLRSRGFREYAIRKIVQQLEDSTGGRAEIRGVDFSLSTLTAHLYDITLHGTEAPGEPPLLHLDKLTVGLKILSALHRKVNLNELVLEHPVIHLQVNRNGKNNVPQAPPSQTSSHTNVFDLAVAHVLLTNGEINYNDKKTPVDADLYGLGTEIRFNPLTTRYSGSISYDSGHLRYAHYTPLSHSFNAKFNATPSAFALESAVMRVASSTVTLHANVSNYSNPTADGDYDIYIHTQDFAAISPGTTPAGEVSLKGKLHYQNANQPLLRCVTLSGQMRSDALAVTSSQTHLSLRKLQGQFQLANGTFRVNDVNAESLGGRLRADLEIQHLDTTPVSQLKASLRSISLEATQQALHQPDVKQVALSGLLDGTATASWTGSLNNLSVHSDLALRNVPNRTPIYSATEIPVDGVIHLIYDGRRSTLTLRQSTLRIPSTTLTADGEVSEHSSLQIHAAATNLRELAILISGFGSGQSRPPAVAGTAALDATVQGSIRQPRLAGQLSAQNLRVQGSEWTSAKVTVNASPSQFAVANGSLVNAHQGKVTFSASVGLRDWSYLPQNPINANLSVQQMSVSDLQRLANVNYRVSGDLSANISLQGSQLNPVGSASAELIHARAYDEPLQNLVLKVRAQNGSIASALNLALDAGSLSANLSYTPKTRAYNLRLDAPAIVLEKLRTVQAKNLALTGTLKASAAGQGTLDNPQLTASLQLPKLEMRQKSISGLKANVRVADHHADLTLDSQVAESSVRARAHMNLTANYYTDASFDTTTVPLDVLLATYMTSVPEGFKGETEFHATLKGPLNDKSQIEAHLTIPKLDASYQSLQIGAAGPIRADYSHSIVTLQPAEIRGTGTSLRMQGSVPLAGTTAPTLTAQGSVDVRILRIVAPDVQSSGILALDVRTSGSAQNPDVQGQLRLQDIAIATVSAPLGLEKLNGTLDIGGNRVQISKLTGQVGGGQISAGGSIAYRPSLQFNVALQGQSVRLRYPDGLRMVLNSDLALSGTLAASNLNGHVLVDSLSFTPDFDLAKFADQFSANTAPAQPGMADNMKLAISVQTADRLSATSSQVSIEGQMNLRVIGTAANPVITGRTDLSSGELFYRNVRYELEQSVITFDNPYQTEPVLNVAVNTVVAQYNLTLNLRGPFDKLTTTYISDPPLATADIINLIARGKTTGEAAASSQSTDSMIASQAASQFSSSVQKLAGISSLQIDPVIGGNNQNPSARVAIQQRITKNFLFTFSTDVSQPGAEVVQGAYQINKRWSVSVSRDQLGGVSIDGRFHTKF